MTSTEKIAQGILLILKYEPGAQTYAEHDEIYCGAYNPDLMTPEDRTKMEEWGWLESTEFDCWYHFT